MADDCHFEKSINCHISAMDQRIAIKFGTVMHVARMNCQHMHYPYTILYLIKPQKLQKKTKLAPVSFCCKSHRFKTTVLISKLYPQILDTEAIFL